MRVVFGRWTGACLLAVVMGQTGVAPAAAQPAPGMRAQAGELASPAEVQRLFDAYTAMQAQDVLNLDDAQFSRFLPRLRALQDTRRRHLIERQRLVIELGRLTAPGVTTLDEPRVREQMRALADLDGRAAGDVRAAYDALDQILDLRRQARFRLFEQQMERRKFELMLRARRGAVSRVPREPR